MLLSYFKVDLGRMMKIRNAAIQGAKDGRGYIKSYTVSTRDYTGSPWRAFQQNDKPKVCYLMCLITELNIMKFIELFWLNYSHCRGFQLGTKVIRNCFGFALLRCDWLTNFTPPTQPIRCKLQNQSRLGRMRFPALGAGYVYFL